MELQRVGEEARPELQGVGEEGGQDTTRGGVVNESRGVKTVANGEEEGEGGEEKDEEEGEDSGRSKAKPDQARVEQSKTYLEKVNERKRTWDYFEINHPKAISDKKLEQLKAKYTRRKTETALVQMVKDEKKEEEQGKSEREGRSEKEGRSGKERRAPPVTTRTISMPVIKAGILPMQVGLATN